MHPTVAGWASAVCAGGFYLYFSWKKRKKERKPITKINILSSRVSPSNTWTAVGRKSLKTTVVTTRYRREHWPFQSTAHARIGEGRGLLFVQYWGEAQLNFLILTKLGWAKAWLRTADRDCAIGTWKGQPLQDNANNNNSRMSYSLV